MAAKNLPDDADKNELLELAITELRRILDSLNSDYNQAKIKIITFLGAGLATLTYLYNGGDIFFPDEVYGMIFYCVGLGLTLAALTILFIALSPVMWSFPTEIKDMHKLKFETKTELLEYIKEEYVSALNNNIALYEKKQKLLSLASYQLIIGAIILVVLNQFGG